MLSVINVIRKRKMELSFNNLSLASLRKNAVFRFSTRFLGYLAVLWVVYQSYLIYTHSHGELDWVTYKVSELSHGLATLLGVANCEFSCFIDGCYVGREGKMVNVLEGCNGLKLAIVYVAYLLSVNGLNYKVVPQLILGMIIIQLVNVVRIGVLVALRDLGGDTYFFFIKHIFGLSIYLSIVVLWLINPLLTKLFDKWTR